MTSYPVTRRTYGLQFQLGNVPTRYKGITDDMKKQKLKHVLESVIRMHCSIILK